MFDAPDGKEGRWLSRVAALPGEVVEVTDAGLRIDGKPAALPSHLSHVAHHPPRRTAPAHPPLTKYPFTVPSDGYFVLGDNVDNALDSRYWGALDSSKILGKVLGK
jgi:signal peptidase I